MIYICGRDITSCLHSLWNSEARGDQHLPYVKNLDKEQKKINMILWPSWPISCRNPGNQPISESMNQFSPEKNELLNNLTSTDCSNKAIEKSPLNKYVITSKHMAHFRQHCFLCLCVHLAVEEVWGHPAEHHQRVLLYGPVHSLSGHHLQSLVVRLVMCTALLLWFFVQITIIREKTTTTQNTQSISFLFGLFNLVHRFSSSQFTFPLLARSLDHLLFTSLSLLSLPSNHLLISGCRLYIQLVANTQEQKTRICLLQHWSAWCDRREQQHV